MSLLLQNEEGNWFYTSYMGDRMVYEPIADSSVLFDLDKLNSYLRDHGIVKEVERDFTKSSYIEGDFTEALSLADDYNKNINLIQYNPNIFQSVADILPNKAGGVSGTNYSLFWNNCGHIAMNLFSMGITPDGTTTYAEELHKIDTMYKVFGSDGYPRYSPKSSFNLVNSYFGFRP